MEITVTFEYHGMSRSIDFNVDILPKIGEEVTFKNGNIKFHCEVKRIWHNFSENTIELIVE